MLTIKNLKVQVANQPILKGVSLSVKPGEIHALMGPNGSGKSTLAYTIAGHPDYEVTSGQIKLKNKNVLFLSPDERSQSGIFLAFQYPVEVPGVRVEKFLRLSFEARFPGRYQKEFGSVLKFRHHLESLARQLSVNPKLLRRHLNENFSGGEKKRLELLQLTLLEPHIAVLDETDSGLDIDAIKAVAQGVNNIVHKTTTAVLVITHYQRILKFLKPDFVHVMIGGTIVKTGNYQLAKRLEKRGYNQWSLKTKSLITKH